MIQVECEKLVFDINYYINKYKILLTVTHIMIGSHQHLKKSSFTSLQ
jgi:hypothetical protein